MKGEWGKSLWKTIASSNYLVFSQWSDDELRTDVGQQEQQLGGS